MNEDRWNECELIEMNEIDMNEWDEWDEEEWVWMKENECE